jgi:N-acylglucosamine-6-phosphate 2-epimerase
MAQVDAERPGLFPLGSIIISCQAPEGSPLRHPRVMALMAQAAVEGGASGIRAAGAADVKEIKRSVPVPVIGLVKRRYPDSAVYITPTFEDAIDVARAGADAIAIDATVRRRPGGVSTEELIDRITGELGLPVVADVDAVDAALAAASAGAAFVASTLSGYTGGIVPEGPDIDLVGQLHDVIDRPILAEGRYREPLEIQAAFRAGAHAVVIGGAVTDPRGLTRRLVDAVRANMGSGA